MFSADDDASRPAPGIKLIANERHPLVQRPLFRSYSGEETLREIRPRLDADKSEQFNAVHIRLRCKDFNVVHDGSSSAKSC